MSVREIRFLGDPVLRERASPVNEVDEEVRALIEDLTDTMYEADGIGLAAPQIGVPLRVFVFDVRDAELPSGALVVPVIVDRCGTIEEEGDHLDGVQLIDHVTPLKRKLLMKKWARREESEHAPTHVL